METLAALFRDHPVAQTLGFVAMLLGCASFQCRTQRSIVVLQAVASAFWTIHFGMLGAVTGAIANLFSVPRNIIYAEGERRKWAASVLWPILFTAVFAAGGVYSRLAMGESWIFLLSVAAQTTSSWVLRIRNAQRLRLLSIAMSLCWLAYDALSDSIPGTLCEIMNQVSIFSALWRYRGGRHEPEVAGRAGADNGNSGRT